MLIFSLPPRPLMTTSPRTWSSGLPLLSRCRSSPSTSSRVSAAAWKTNTKQQWLYLHCQQELSSTALNNNNNNGFSYVFRQNCSPIKPETSTTTTTTSTIIIHRLVQVNLDMTDSMGPGKLVRHMQYLSYTRSDTYLICIGLGPSILYA